jgi:hypothetical protein
MHDQFSFGDFEPNYYLRRDQTRGGSYCIPVNPYPGECLEDLLIRAACENGFSPMMSYKLLGIEGGGVRANAAPTGNRLGISPEALSILIGNVGGPDELAPLLHYVDPPRRQLKPFFGSWLEVNDLSAKRRVSPRALRRAPYLRAIWRVWPIEFDPETKEMLLANCPVCGQKLGAGFMGDVWCCDRCGKVDAEGQLQAVDLREHEQQLVDERFWDDLDFATSWIDPCASVRRQSLRSNLHTHFCDVSDSAVFRIILALARVTRGSPLQWSGRTLSASNLAAAARVVRGWPKAFEEHFLVGSEDPGRLPKSTFFNLLHNYRLDKSVRVRMREIIRGSAVNAALRGTRLVEVSPVANHDHQYRTMRIWVARGAADAGLDVHSDAILLRSRTAVRKFSEQIGIPIPSLMAAVDNGVCPSELVTETSLADASDQAQKFIRRLRGNAQRSKMPGNAIRLPRAVSALFVRPEEPWGRIIKALFSGEIEYWNSNRTASSLLETLYIEDLPSLREILARGSQASRSYQTIPLSAKEASHFTRLQVDGLPAAVRAGLFSPPFTFETIAKFRSEFELSNLLAIRHIPSITHRMRPETLASLGAAGIAPILMNSGRRTTLWYRAELERHFGADLIPCVE